MAKRKPATRRQRDGLSRSELITCMRELHRRLADQTHLLQAVQSCVVLPMPHPWTTVLMPLIARSIGEISGLRDCAEAWGRGTWEADHD